ncbi:MAG: hypothetical protein K2J31_04490, partial [Alistipes sp.]|nr:hypothetical protein [Alistipes sp.]
MDRKETIITRIVATLAVAMSFTACYDSPTTPATSVRLPAANCNVSTLRELYDGRTRVLDTDLTIVGRVTTSDSQSNFYKSLVIEDDSGAVEIMAGITDISTTYPIGVALAVSLKGCALGQSYGVMQIGRQPTPQSGYATDYFASKILLDSHITRGDDISAVEAKPAVIADLRRDMCGRLVRIDSLRIRRQISEEGYIVPNIWSGYVTFFDPAGDSLVV